MPLIASKKNQSNIYLAETSIISILVVKIWEICANLDLIKMDFWKNPPWIKISRDRWMLST